MRSVEPQRYPKPKKTNLSSNQSYEEQISAEQLDDDKVQAASCSEDTTKFEDSFERILKYFSPFQEAQQQLTPLNPENESHGKRRNLYESKNGLPYMSHQSQTERCSNVSLEWQLHHARLRMERLVSGSSFSQYRMPITSSKIPHVTSFSAAANGSTEKRNVRQMAR